MNTRNAAAPRPATISRRAGLRYAGGLAVAAAAWLFARRPAWAQTPASRTFALDIRDGHVAADKRTIRVTEGDRVELRWTTDAALELHLHGYDITLELNPGGAATMIVDARITGRFPVSIHGHGGGHGHGNVVYLEVHPR